MRLKKWAAVLAVLMLLCTCTAWGEEENMFESEWYQQAVRNSELRLGNNARLKNVIERARGGEEITIATIGGSITEGAGASSYQECWASRLAKRFGSAYGVNNGANVHLVNAGVGGTPSTFGLMRYERDILSRVPEKDADGLPDVVVIEFSVNDWQEPTGHRCFEALVKEALDAKNQPAVILLFAVFKTGFTLQDELRKIGETYDLMMVSIRDGFFGRIGNGKELGTDEFFHDEYHPTSLGHRIMTDCLMQTIGDAAEAETSVPQDTNVPPAFGTDFVGLKTIYGGIRMDGYEVERGGFSSVDQNTYRNGPVGWVCGKNFFHDSTDSMEPLTVKGVFRKCLVAWKAANDPAFGAAEILMDGNVIMTLKGGADKWGQSEVVLVLDDMEPAEHTLEIRVKEQGKRFTITAIGLQ